MTYTDGNKAKLGDVVIISDRYKGTVVANIDGDEYADTHPKRDWSQLSSGVLIDTNFGGLVHYEQEAFFNEKIELKSRARDDLGPEVLI